MLCAESYCTSVQILCNRDKRSSVVLVVEYKYHYKYGTVVQLNTVIINQILDNSTVQVTYRYQLQYLLNAAMTPDQRSATITYHSTRFLPIFPDFYGRE
jgi:hypothetical protein